MIDQQEKEYNSVILAALLHDVGKFFERSKDLELHEKKHATGSVKFIEKFSDKLRNNLYDLELVKFLVCHHQPESKGILKKDPYAKDRDENEQEHIWKLVKLMERADNYSCRERIHEALHRRPKAPLTSIFSTINIIEDNIELGSKWRYSLNKIHPLRSFPEKNRDELSHQEMVDYYEIFKREIPDVSQYNEVNDIINVYIEFFEKYTSCIPSDTRYSVKDISLYDHIRTTTAIAACLYKVHQRRIQTHKNYPKKEEFMFIAGDFSGIQNYIFDITNKGSGGASKRLRARSFFISIFCETAIHKILDNLELPRVCNLFSAGGKFLLIAPNINGIKEKLESVKANIAYEIHQYYFNQFSFLMTWKPFVRYEEEARIFDFCKIVDDMFHLLEIEKIQSSQLVFFSNEEDKHSENKKVWDQAAFSLSDDEFQKYAENGDCMICGKGPGEFSERSGTEENPVSIQVCRVCYMNKKIGKILPKKQFVCFGKGKGNTNKRARIALFHENDNGEAYYVDLSDEAPASDDYYLIWNLNNDGKGMTIDRWPLVRKNLANHVLTDEDGSVVSFEDLARRSRWTNTEDSKEYGSDFLGVLKADVDNLGLVFSKGFDTPERPRAAEKHKNKEGELPKGTDARSVSRFLTLSRMLELFFSGWIGSIMEKDAAEIQQLILDCQPDVDINLFQQYLDSNVIDFKNIYTVYSGGDDLVLIGPWETMIIFAILLNAKFREYTCQNKSFTLSAGLTFVKSKFPIATAIREAEALLEKSKSKDKNRITMFGTTVEWGQMPELLNFFLFLDSRLKDKDSNINMSFLYSLLDYHQMALSYIDEDKIEGLKFASALNYDLGRNIYSGGEYKGGEIRDKKKRNEEMRQINKLLDIKKEENSLMYRIKLCVFWSLYRNRGVH